MKNKKINIYKLRLLFWPCLIFVIAWILYRGIVPFGHISYFYEFPDGDFILEKIHPEDRISTSGKDSVKIIGDPVYFNLRTSRKFDSAKVTLRYRDMNEDCASCPRNKIIEFGALADKDAWRYDLKPVENIVLDELAKKWQILQEGGTLLLQKNQRYASIENFLAAPPRSEKIATYNFSFRSDYRLPGYAAGAKETVKETVIDRPLRGAFQFYTYIKNERLDFDFIFSDLNKNNDKDTIDLNIYYQGGKIKSLALADDGNSTDNNKESAPRELGLLMEDLQEGAYKIELKANDDIITRSIRTKQSKLAFIHSLWLHKTYEKGAGLSLVTDSRELNIKTIHPDSLQAIKIGNSQTLPIAQTYKQFSAKIDESPPVKIRLEKDGVILAGDGMFSFSQAEFFDPVIKKLNQNSKIEDEDLEYVIANYTPPAGQDRLKTARIDIDLKKAYRENYRYSLMVSVPGLKADDSIDDGIEIKEIRVDLEGKNIWQFLANLMEKW